MSRIVYEFQAIENAMSTINGRVSDIDTIISTVSSFSCDVPELSGDLESAKGKTNNVLNDLKTKLETLIKKTNNLCEDYLTFESKMQNHAIFSSDLTVDITNSSSTVVGDTVQISEKYNIVTDSVKTYDIKLGDTLGHIAKEYNVSVDSIVKANKDVIKDPNLIYVGDTLNIPVASTVVAATGSGANLVDSDKKTKTNNKSEDKNNKSKVNNIDKDNKSNLVQKKVINVPKSLGNTHTYMGWQMITSPSSNQYKFRNDVGMNFDSEGFGVVDDRYVVACTTTYGNVGDYVDFVQKDGTVINAVIGDIKNQADPGCTTWGHNNGDCIVEFVVDKNTWYSNGSGSHVNPGNSNCHPEWNQDIVQAINYGSYYDYK